MLMWGIGGFRFERGIVVMVWRGMADSKRKRLSEAAYLQWIPTDALAHSYRCLPNGVPPSLLSAFTAVLFAMQHTKCFHMARHRFANYTRYASILQHIQATASSPSFVLNQIHAPHLNAGAMPLLMPIVTSSTKSARYYEALLNTFNKV
jgi:hypothetical protein